MVSISSIYSTLGNSSSLVPLAIKDVANSCGLTAASYLAGDEHEGKDRLIDEFGTQAIWLWGIPFYKKILDFGIKHFGNLDPAVDVRILKNKEIAVLARIYAPNEEVAKGIQKAINSPVKSKALSVGKFAVSTILTTLSYLGLTKFRHKYTENQIKKEYYKRQNNNKDISFGGKIQDFMFDPVKNLMIVDASITTERLTHARNPQDFLGYLIKEGSFWLFMYFAGDKIKDAIEKRANAKGKSIDLDIRVLENEEFKQAFKTGNILNDINKFKEIEALNDDAKLYAYIVNNQNENLIIKAAKTSDQIQVYEQNMSLNKKFFSMFTASNDNQKLKTGAVDTRAFIDLSNDGIKGTREKIERLYNQFLKSNENADDFFKSIRSLKRISVLKNIGACIGALGILSPAIMLLTRKLSPNSDYQVKVDIENKLKNSKYA